MSQQPVSLICQRCGCWQRDEPHTDECVVTVRRERDALRAQVERLQAAQGGIVVGPCEAKVKDCWFSDSPATPAPSPAPVAKRCPYKHPEGTTCPHCHDWPDPAPFAQEAADTGADERVERALGQFYMGVSDSDKTPYPGMAEAFEGHFGQSWQDRDWRQEASTWAAAWRKAWDQRAGQVAAPAMVPLTPDTAMHLVDVHVGGPSPSYPLDSSDWINFSQAVIAEFCRINGLTVGGSKAGGDK